MNCISITQFKAHKLFRNIENALLFTTKKVGGIGENEKPEKIAIRQGDLVCELELIEARACALDYHLRLGSNGRTTEIDIRATVFSGGILYNVTDYEEPV